MLNKDVQDILEGVHYFLQEALPAEPLSGKLECLRRGLVMQLEALALSYPTLRIKSSSVSNRSSMSYLAMDQTSTLPMPHLMNHHNVSGSGASTSGSSACYSNGSSGDGVMLATGGGSVGATDITEQQLQQDEEYEDFTGENNRDSGILSADPAEQEELDDRDESEDVYMEAVEWQPFSKVIAKCEKHGVLMKRTKGLLRNLKNYHCVAVNGLLYLYLKETDERQKKTIDLLGYTCRDAIGDDIKDTRKRDAAFEIVGPGKKTHIFIARTARDKIQWLSALSRAIKTGRTKPVALPSSLKIATVASKPTRLQNIVDLPSATKTINDNVPEKQEQDKGASEVYYHDVAGDVMDEVYEEVGEEAYSRTKLPVPATTICLTTSTQEEDYDPVSPDEIPPLISPNSTPSKRPPDRPPLPACVQEIVKQQSARPLPEAPIIDPDSGSDSDGYYCEIEEEIPVDAKQSEQDITLRDLELEMNDSPIPTRTPLTNSFSDSVLAYIPSHLSKYKITPEKSHTPPKLPARGIPFATTEDDSEYKVPVIAIIDEEYQIPPPNPILADKLEKSESERNFSNISQDQQETYQIPSSHPVIKVDNTLMDSVEVAPPNKPSLTSRNYNKSLDNIANNTTSSFKNRYKTLTPRDAYFINPDSLEKKSSNENENKRLSQGSSVKDLIAKLNKTPNQDQAIATKDINLTSPGLEFQSQNSSKQDSIKKNEIDVEQNSSPVKPALPPRPLNLQTSKSLSEENENNNKSESNDKSGASSPVKDIGSIPWRNKNEAKKQLFGEYYTAKFAFVATTPDGLSFSRGDEVFVHSNKGDNGPGWWKANIKGKEGLVPKEYLKKKVEDQLT